MRETQPSVLYEDNHLLVVNKPSGMLTQSDISGDINLLDICRDYIREKYQKKGNVFIGMVHRLDRPVAGVIVFARTSKAASRLSEQIRNGTMEKRYLAVVDGVLDDSGTLSHHLIRRGAVQVTKFSLPKKHPLVLLVRVDPLESPHLNHHLQRLLMVN